MGCMYSKAITRSMSIREELISNSHSGNNEQLLALATKLRNRSLAMPSIDLVESDAATSASVAEPDWGRLTRSRSCQIFGDEREMSAHENENKLDSKDKNLEGSRSFHTVEEYDAFLERIHKSSPKTEEYSDASENILQEDGTCEIGWKRKAIGKGLKSLDISAIEFPSVSRFRQRVYVEDYVTPKFGSYNDATVITRAKQEKECGENSVFSPELVAAFEDCMKQLELEEEIFLQRMDRYLPANDEEEKLLECSTKMEV